MGVSGLTGTYRLEYSRLPPSSWDGDPAPTLTPLALTPEDPKPLGSPKGDRVDVAEPPSMGEVSAVEGPDLGRLALICGR